MQKTLATLATVALLVCSVQAISIKWTGYANNNQWFTPTNWYPDQVPTTADDVTIASGNVQVPSAAGCNSINFGTDFNTPANLTIFNTFIVGNGGMTVNGNGNLIVNSGAAAITGVVNVEGNVFFQSGSISGKVTVNSRGAADLSGAAQKVFTAAEFISQGKLTIGGNIVLNQSSQFIVQSTAVASGNVAIMCEDASQALFDSSAGTLRYTGGGNLALQAPVKLGTFDFQAGNLSIYTDVSFLTSFEIPSNSYVSTLGLAKVNMSAGVTGAGVLSGASAQLLLGDVNVTGYVNCAGGNVSFVSGKSAVAALTLDGGKLAVTAPVNAAMFSVLNGALVGSLTAQKGYIKSQGFDLNGQLTFTDAVSTAGQTLIAFGPQSSLAFGASAQLNVGGSLQLTGAPGRSVTNNGVINANSDVAVQNINIQGGGSINVASTLKVGSDSVAQGEISLASGATFKGATTELTLPKISAPKGGKVTGVIGAYKFTCDGSCTNVDTTAEPTSTFTFSA